MENEAKELPLATTALPPLPVVTIAGHGAVVTSLQVADHFGKRHKNVLRAINNLGCSADFNRLNFEPIEHLDPRGRVQTMYHITRDGFAMLAMGFTGPAAMLWKESYILAFNLMEAKLREPYIAPLLEDKAFRATLKLQDKLKLHAQSTATAQKLEAESRPRVRLNLYWQLRQINDALGIPTESLQAWVGEDTPSLPAAPD